jgi:pentatricopeptide repeat protein
VTPTTQQQLASALRERIAIIGDEESRRDPDRHMERLKAISERIESLSASLPRPIDPRLGHFLERRSYDKALEMLEEMRNDDSQ